MTIIINHYLTGMICTRLDKANDDAGGLSPKQFGFRKGMSTTDAIGRVVRIASEAAEGTRWNGVKNEYCFNCHPGHQKCF